MTSLEREYSELWESHKNLYLSLKEITDTIANDKVVTIGMWRRSDNYLNQAKELREGNVK